MRGWARLISSGATDIVHIGRHAVQPLDVVLVLLAAAWLVVALFFAPQGLWTDDEIIYVAMIDRFATSGGFVIENGYDLLPAKSLQLKFLLPGPAGLVAQYPAGFAVLAAPFYLLGGLQGVILLNTMATVLTLWLTYLIALELFEDERLAAVAALIFGLATFAVDYAFAIWPHATSNLFVAGATYGAVRCVRQAATAWKWAALSGLLVGLGVTIRVEVILAAPFLFAWVFVNARSPGRTLSGFAVALAASLSVAAWLNYCKFGQFNPLSYGIAMNSGSYVSLGGYMRYVPFAAMAGLLAMSLRWQRAQQLLMGRSGLALLAAGVLGVAAWPSARQLMAAVLNGLYALVVDLGHLEAIDAHPRINAVGSDYYVFYGTLKKSLVESLPFLGLAIFGVFGMFQSKRRAGYVLCVLFPLVWFLPFAAKEWIGGRANNLRYFSPMLPMLAILGAMAWREIGYERKSRIAMISLGSALLAGFFLLGSAGVVDSLSPIQAFFVTGGAQLLALALLVLSLLWLKATAWRPWMRPFLVLLAQTAFLLAFIAAYPFDVVRTWQTRNAVENQAQLLGYVEPEAHVFATGQFALYFQLLRPKATLAFYEPDDIETDLELMNIILREGRPVYIMTPELTRLVMKALQDNGYSYGPGGFEIERSVSPLDGQYYGFFQLRWTGQ